MNYGAENDLQLYSAKCYAKTTHSPVYHIFPSASREHQAGLSADREGWGQRRLEQKSEGSDQTAAAHHHQGASRCHEAKRWGKMKSLTIIGVKLRQK